MDVEEGVAVWLECRVGRLCWLSGMMEAIWGWEDYLSGMDGFVMDVGGTLMVCMLNPSCRVIDSSLIRQLPRHARKSSRMWVKLHGRFMEFERDYDSRLRECVRNAMGLR